MSGCISKMLLLLLFDINIYRSIADDVVKGGIAVLGCPITGSSVNWLKFTPKEWVPMTNDQKYDNAKTSHITIRDVEVTDSGQYLCQVGHDARNIFLNVVVYETQGSTVVWNCPFTGTTHQWYKQILDDWKTLRDNNKYNGASTSKMTIRSVDVADSGDYICYVDGESSNKIVLNVTATPIVNISKPNYLAIVGDNVTLDCIVTGYPIASDIWWTNGQGLRLNGTRYSGGSLLNPSLAILNVVESDSGQYTCFATNTAGMKAQSTQLEAGYIPSAKIAMEQYVTTTGKNVSIEYEVTHADAVYWYKDKTVLNVGIKYNFGATQNTSLLIYDVTTNDSGVYKCNVTNKFGSHSVETLLKIVHTVILNSSYEKTANESVTLQCLICDAEEVKWRHNHKNIQTDSDRFSGGNIIVPSLTVTKLNRDDTGKYQCESLYGSVSSVSSEIILKIRDKPIVKPFEKNIQTSVGEDVMIPCSFDSYPTPTRIFWTKDDNIINVSDNTKYNGSNVKTPSLTIYNIVNTDSGIYVCYVENNIGISSGTSIQLAVEVAEASTFTSIIGPVAGGVFAGVLAVFIAVVAVLLYTKRRKTTMKKENRRGNNKLNQDKSSYRHEANNEEMYIRHEKMVSALETDVCLPVTNLVQNSTEDDSHTYFNVGDAKTAVQVEDLKAYIAKKEINDGLRKEYKKIPYGILHPTTKAELKENMPKNRFKTTFPYDHTIVILETVHETANSDYINANYVDGFNKDKCYIASQGPIKQTLRDHWRMIWQHNTRQIVMLTNLVEGSKVKCERYWPIGGKPMTLDNIVMTLESENERAAYITREISVENKKTNEKRSVIQYHFTAWPDHGTPDPLYLVLFHKHFMNDHNKMQGGPVLVHCSAGIGRTGTFIALDALLEEGRSTGNVDIIKCVNKMRYCRMNMIQTEDQYVCLHHALLEAFSMEDTSISKENFVLFWRDIQSDKRPVNQQRLNEEFRKLNIKKSEHEDPVYKDATSTENIDKNRTKSVLAMDNNRVYLVSVEKGRSNYINAVQVPSYTKFVGYITTQLPLPDTKIDFWTMIRDQHSSTIVLILNDLKEADLVYAISDDSFTCGQFSVKIKRKDKIENNITEATLVLNKKDEKPREIALYQTVCKDRPNPQDLCRLDNLLSTRINMSSDPVTVVSCDGAKNCGLFCTFINAVSSMQIDAKADVFQLARLLQLRRPEFFSDYGEYRLVYEALHFYLESTNVYAN